MRITRKEIYEMLAYLNVRLEDNGHSVRYAIDANRKDDKGYMLVDVQTQTPLSNVMTSAETYHALYALLCMVGALREPTPYTRMVEALHGLNDRLARCGSPFRFRLIGPDNGMFCLQRIDLGDASGKSNFTMDHRYNDGAMIEKLARMIDQQEFLHGQEQTT